MVDEVSGRTPRRTASAQASVTRNTLQTLLTHLLIMGQGLVLTPLVVKISGAQVFGEYVLLISCLSIMFGVSSLGVGVGAKRWLPSALTVQDRQRTFLPQFWFQMLSASAIGLLAAVTCVVVTGQVEEWPLHFSPWLIPVYLGAYTLFSQGADYFRNTHQLSVFNIATLAQPYLFIGLALSCYWVTGDLTISALLNSLIAGTALVGLLLAIMLSREIGLHYIGFQRSALAKEVRLGIPLMMGFLVDTLLAGGDRFIIAAILTVRDVGAYAPAYALGALLMVLPRAFGVVLPPLIMQRVDAGDIAGAKRLSESAARVFVAVALPYTCGAAVLGREILALYANRDIAEAAWPVIPLAALASTFYGLNLIKANVAFIRLKTGLLFWNSCISLTLSLLLNLVLLRLFESVIAAAAASLLAYAASYRLLSRTLATEEVSFSIDIAWLACSALAACGMLVGLKIANTVLPTDSVIMLMLQIVGGAALYLALMLAQRPVREELGLLIRGVWKR